MSLIFEQWQNREISDIECIRKLESQNIKLLDYTNSQDAKIKYLEQKNKNLQDAITKYIEGRK